MSRADFRAMTPPEFEAVAAAYTDDRRYADLAQWNRLRTHAAITIRPHVTKAIPPEKLVPLPELDNSTRRKAHIAPPEPATPIDAATMARLTADFAADISRATGM